MLLLHIYSLFWVLVTTIQAINLNKKPMTGVHLKIAAYHEPPVFSIIRNSTNASAVRYVGFPKDVFDLLATSLNFTFSFVEVTPSMVKSIGSIDSAMIDQLLTKRADINWRFNPLTAEMLALVDFTASITVLRFALLQPMPKIQSRFLAPVRPFQPTVWYFILVAFVATIVALTITNRITVGHKSSTYHKIWTISQQNILFAFEVLMSQGAYLPSKSLSLRFVAGAWCLISIVVVYAYNSTLISHISLPKYEPIIDTWEDLAASKILRVAIPRGGLFADNIMKATSGVMKTLGDSLRRNPNDLIMSLPGEIDRVLKSGCCAYVEIKKIHEILVSRSLVQNGGKCTMTIGKDLDYSQVWCFTVVKNLPYLPIINHEIQRLRQNGILHLQGKTYYKSIDKCLDRKIDRSKKNKLTLVDLASAFFVLVLGYFIPILVFLGELVFSSRRCSPEYKFP